MSRQSGEPVAQPKRLASAWHAERSLETRRRLWASALFVIAIAALDVRGYFVNQASWRFALVLLAVFLVCGVPRRHSRITLRPGTAPDRIITVLYLFGVIGSLYGAVVGTAKSPALAVFAPMPLALLHLTTLGRMGDEESWVNLRRLGTLAGVYVCVHAATVLGVLPRFGGGQRVGSSVVEQGVLGHERSFLIAIALVAVWMLGTRGLFAALLVFSAVVFGDYPAGTYLVVALVAVATLVATGRRSGRPLAYLMAGLVVGLLVAIYAQVTMDSSSRRSSLAGAYFDLVDKGDNTETRAELWREAVERIAESPLIGSAFTGDISLKVVLAGRLYSVPPHNDFLQIGMGGGIVAVALLVTWVAATNVVAGRRCRRLLREAEYGRAQLIRLLLVGYNTFFAVALLNPAMVKLGLNAIAMLLYAMLMSVDPPESGSEQEQLPAAGPVGGRG